jgi:hypothetical protein
MEETGKKAKAPAKPRKTTEKTTKKKETAVEGIALVAAPSREQIAELARRYWAERGWQDGYAEQDWLRAERELLGKAS